MMLISLGLSQLSEFNSLFLVSLHRCLHFVKDIELLLLDFLFVGLGGDHADELVDLSEEVYTADPSFALDVCGNLCELILSDMDELAAVVCDPEESAGFLKCFNPRHHVFRLNLELCGHVLQHDRLPCLNIVNEPLQLVLMVIVILCLLADLLDLHLRTPLFELFTLLLRLLLLDFLLFFLSQSVLLVPFGLVLLPLGVPLSLLLLHLLSGCDLVLTVLLSLLLLLQLGDFFLGKLLGGVIQLCLDFLDSSLAFSELVFDQIIRLIVITSASIVSPAVPDSLRCSSPIVLPLNLRLVILLPFLWCSLLFRVATSDEDEIVEYSDEDGTQPNKHW